MIWLTCLREYTLACTFHLYHTAIDKLTLIESLLDGRSADLKKCYSVLWAVDTALCAVLGLSDGTNSLQPLIREYSF